MFFILSGSGFLIMGVSLFEFLFNKSIATFIFQTAMFIGLSSVISIALMLSVLAPKYKKILVITGIAIAGINGFAMYNENPTLLLNEVIFTQMQLITFNIVMIISVSVGIIFLITGAKTKNKKYKFLGHGLIIVGLFTALDAIFSEFIYGFLARIGILIGAGLMFYSTRIKTYK